MNHHFGILQQGIESIAVIGQGAAWNVAGQKRKWRRSKVQQREEEDLNCGENRSGVGVQLYIVLMREAQDEAVAGEEPCPEKQ